MDHPARTCLLLAVALTGCGSSGSPPPKQATPAIAKRCGLSPAPGGGGFPAGLLPPGAVVTGEGIAIVPGRLADVFAQLRTRGTAAGLALEGSELEALDAELEFGGAGLRLSLPRDCPRATQVELAG